MKFTWCDNIVTFSRRALLLQPTKRHVNERNLLSIWSCRTGVHASRATAFSTVAPNVWGSSLGMKLASIYPADT